MASTTFLLRVLAVLAFYLITSGFTEAQTQDPVTYFDGTDNNAYLEWLDDTQSWYTRSEFMPSPAGNETGAAIHWTIKYDLIYLAMAAKATGWISFGIAESGGMFGADVVTYLANTESLIDGYIEDERFVMPDDCQSWTLLNNISNGGFLIFEAVRALDTGDTQDRPIMQDGNPSSIASRVIAAWSDSPSLINHGPNNRAMTSLHFYDSEGDDFATAMANEAEGFIDLKAVNHSIKAEDTEYAYFCFTYADLVAQGIPEGTELHTIGVEPLIDSIGQKYVHHFVLMGSTQGDLSANGTNCSNTFFTELAYAWAPGEAPLLLPSNLGGPLGENGFKTFQLETHYNNPWLDEGIVDSSGVRLYYTSKKRELEFGIMQIGDPFVQLAGTQAGPATHQFDCPSSCSTLSLNQSVTVVREYLHMHRTGDTMSNQHIRDGQVIREGRVDFFDFSQQGAYAIQQEPFEIQPGDSFKTTCQYSSPDAVFGISSQQEMCVVFLMYYPRTTRSFFGTEVPFTCGYDIPIPECASDWQQTALESSSDLDRTFGTPSDTCVGSGGSTYGAWLASGVVSFASALAATVLSIL